MVNFADFAFLFIFQKLHHVTIVHFNFCFLFVFYLTIVNLNIFNRYIIYYNISIYH